MHWMQGRSFVVAHVAPILLQKRFPPPMHSSPRQTPTDEVDDESLETLDWDERDPPDELRTEERDEELMEDRELTDLDEIDLLLEDTDLLEPDPSELFLLEWEDPLSEEPADPPELLLEPDPSELFLLERELPD